MSPAASSAPAASAASPTGAGLKVSTQPRPNSRLAVEVAVPGGRCSSSYDKALDQLRKAMFKPPVWALPKRFVFVTVGVS